MNMDEKNEALENIKMIKHLISATKDEIVHFNGGWIAIIWGIFCAVGFMGQRFVIPWGPWEGLWWTLLSGLTAYGSYLIARRKTRDYSPKAIKYIMRKFFIFWIPLIILGYTLMAFCLVHPDVSLSYIPIAIMLVVSTGYLIIGLLAEKIMFIMGCVGYCGSVLTAIYLLKVADIVFSILFGGGLILSGILMNLKQRIKE